MNQRGFASTNSKVLFILCRSGLNFLDLMVRQGTIDNPPKPPLVPGFECSGIVESVGENTTGFEVSAIKYCCDVCMNVSEQPNLQTRDCKKIMRYLIKLINNLLITSSLMPRACFTLASVCYPATVTCFFQIGDRVMAFVNYNAWAEVVCTPVDFVYKMPDEMTFAEAAAFSLNFVAAYMMLFEVANLREGMSVLVHSAGGGVVSPFLI